MKTIQAHVASPDILSRHLSGNLSEPSYTVPPPVFEPVTFRLQGSRAAQSTAKSHVAIRVDRWGADNIDSRLYTANASTWSGMWWIGSLVTARGLPIMHALYLEIEMEKEINYEFDSH